MLSDPQLLQIIHDQLANANPSLLSLNDLLEGTTAALLADHPDFEKAIFNLELHRDRRANIISVPLPGAIWYRDARQSDHDVLKSDCWENYVILSISYISTLFTLLELHNPPTSGLGYSQLRQVIKVFIAQWLDEKKRKSPHEIAASLLVCIIQLTKSLFAITEDVAKQYIEVGKDFVNMKNTSLLIVTISERESLPLTIEVETPIVIKSPALTAEYKQCRTKEWFNALAPWIQQWVLFAIERIEQGAMIPTQLRKYLPGPRNIYQRKVGWLEKFNEIYWLNHFYHSGTPGHLFKQDSESTRLTQLSIEAIKESIPCRHLHINTLLSPLTIRPKEMTVFKQIVAVVDNRYIHHSNTPLNHGRKVVDNILDQILLVCDSVGKSRARKEDAMWFMYIKMLLKNTILPMITQGQSDDENRNLRIQSLFIYLISLLEDPEDQIDLLNCLSGKDRTGILLLYSPAMAMTLGEVRKTLDPLINAVRNPKVTCEQISLAFLPAMPGNQFELTLQKNLLQLVGSGLVVLLAGACGGTRGCASLKDESESAVPKSLLSLLKPYLFNKSAKFNTIGPKMSFLDRVRAVQGNKSPYQAILDLHSLNNDDDNPEFQDLGSGQSISL